MHLFRSWTSLAQVELALLCGLCSISVLAIDPNALPWPIYYDWFEPTGPDGPWWIISQSVDFPDQYVGLMPSLSDSSLVRASGTCSARNAECPLPVHGGWAISGAYNVNNGTQTESKTVDVGVWDERMTELLSLTGSGHHINNRFTIYDSSRTAFLDNLGMFISENVTVNYPGGAAYTIDVGQFSLSGSEVPISWTAVNGTNYDLDRPLNASYTFNHIPSKSWGLHIGSVTGDIPGSLILGGYDRSRCITQPIVSVSNSFRLVDISVNVTRGGSAFRRPASSGLLRTESGSSSGIDVRPEPGVSYMYLPKETCDAIANFLPVTYSEDLALYLWDTEAPTFSQIVNSPHTLVFSFADGDAISNISVPFALLNLTLASPLVSQPTPYFPCRPWVASAAAPYHLGRAFLQAAFLGNNANTETLFLAQAPGPGYLPENIRAIVATDTTISSGTNPPDWDSTWKSLLTALPAASTAGNSTGGSTDPGTPTSSSDGGISGGAIAGIVIGALLGVGAVGAALWFFVFRKRRQQQQSPSADGVPAEYYQKPQPPPFSQEMGTPYQDAPQYSSTGAYSHPDKNHAPYTDNPAVQAPVEMSTEPRRPVELA